MLRPPFPLTRPARRGPPRVADGAACRLVGVLLALLPLAAACAPAVRGEAAPALRERREPIRKVAVAPFGVAERVAERAEPGDAPAAEAARAAHHFARALEARGVALVPAEEVAAALGLEGSAVASGAEAPAPERLAARVHRRFGADALVLGELTRFVERRGEAAGATRPASASLRVRLFGAPDGEPLWRGAFDETQHPLTDNVMNVGRYPGGGFRWLRGAELVRWGAEEAAGAMPLGDE